MQYGEDNQAASGRDEGAPGAAPAAEPSRAIKRLALAGAGGAAIGVPVGWFLSSLAALPMFLGLFFFLLFGLVVGAVMYRLALPAAPLSKRSLWAVGGGVAVLIWGVGLIAEYRYLPVAAVNRVRESFRFSLPPEQKLRLETAVRAHVQEQLRTQYPPGGFVGYIRWAASQARMECPRVVSASEVLRQRSTTSRAASQPATRPSTPGTVTYRLTQRPWVWVTRVILSLVFLGSAILSQFLGLAPATSAGRGQSPSRPV